MTPQLRFPEFNDEWQVKKFGDIAQFSKGAGIPKDSIVEAGKIEAIRYGELYTTYSELIDEVKSRTNIPIKNLVISQANDVIIPASGESPTDIATASCVLREGIALGSDLNVIRTPNDGVFLAYYLNNKKKTDIARLAQGVSVVHLYSSSLKVLELVLPTRPEQQKIAHSLTVVDDKILALEQKIEKLEAYRRGVVQTIFTRRIRFTRPDGSHYPEWTSKKLGNFISDLNEKTTSENEYLVMTSSRRGIVLQTDYYGDENRITDRSNLGYHILPPNYLTYRSRSDDGVFRFNLNTTGRTGIVSYFYPVFSIDNGVEKFFEEYLNYSWKIFYKHSVGTSQKVLSHSELKKIELEVPESEEQQKIADFLSAIDQKITLTTQQLEKAKEFKKGLLQRMFV